MITIQDLNFSYNRGRPLFKNMDLHLEQGHIYGLLGKNGAGKSTLLKNMAGLVFPDSGTITVLGQDPKKRQPSLLRDISFIPEEFYLPPVVSARFIRANAGFYPAFDLEYFQRLISEFEIPERQKLADMSYGQKKKYLIAFGLATNTKLVIMDEPTNGLDIPSKGQFRKIMASALTTDRCLLISTHQVRDLDNLIDAVIMLDQHRVAVNASVTAITEQLCFKKVKDLPEDAIYTESALGGYNSIQVNTTGEDSKLDLELFFNAVSQQPEKIANVLNQPTYV